MGALSRSSLKKARLWLLASSLQSSGLIDTSKRSLEFDKSLGVMRQIEPFFVRNRTNTPVLHGEGAKEDLNGVPVFVFTDAVDHHGQGRDLMPLHISIERRFPQGEIIHILTSAVLVFPGFRGS
jgi:hypothetical protein